MTYELIESCELDDILRTLEEIEGDLYVGMDIGRKKDLSVITGIERLGEVKYTRFVNTLEKMPFHLQEEILYEILKHKNLRRACIDSTGLGMQFAEEAQRNFGQYRVEPVSFTGSVKEELAYSLLRAFQDKNIRIPDDQKLREDLHSVKKITTSSGNIRFDAAKNETDGHADRFWSLALANHAAVNASSGPIYIATRRRRESYKTLRGYD